MFFFTGEFFIFMKIVFNCLVSGFEALFVMLSLHCIAKEAVCCHHAGKVGDFDVISENEQDKFIDNLIQMHDKALDLLQSIDSIYRMFNLAQLLSAMGMVEVLVFEIQTSVEVIVCVIFAAVLFQLFTYCFLGECVSVMVSKISDTK